MTSNRCSGLGHASYDMNHGLNSTTNSSGPGVGESSLVTDANSALSGRRMQRSTSINNESHMRPPASPMSFSSNNISGSSVIDALILQQSPHHDQVYKQGAPSATSETMSQELGNSVNSSKKARLDLKKNDILQHQMIQQLLQRAEPVLQGHQNPQLQAILQQQRLAQLQQHQQHIMQSFPMIQRAPFTFQQQQQLRHHMQQQVGEAASPIKRHVDSVIGSRRLMQYLYHQRHRPATNSILYWRKFVTEYFAPRAKKRWCLSLYDNIGNHALGVFPQSTKDAWQCDLCELKSGKGFEATFEVLPRLFHIKFDRGLIDENLFLGMPRECRLPSGVIVLEYEKTVHESVYEHLCVVREGKLRVIFTPELKILFWDFCARYHEEFLPRRVLAPQVNQLLQVAQKYQTAANESGTTGVPNQDLQESCNMFITAGRQLARNLELQSLNELGFSKRYVRYLQMSEVVNSLKDLIDFSQEHNIGPIESLKNYASQFAGQLQKQKLQETNQPMAAQSMGTDQSILNRFMGTHPAVNNHTNNNLVARRAPARNRPSDLAPDNYHNLANSLKKHDVIQQEQLGPISGSKQGQPTQVQDPSAQSSTSITSNISGQQQQQQQPPLDGYLRLQNNLHPSQVNQHLQQHAIQQMLQQMVNNNRGGLQQSVNATNANGVSTDVIGGGLTGVPVRVNPGPVGNRTEFLNMHHDISNASLGMAPSRNNSFKSVSSNPIGSGNSLNSRADLTQSMMDLPELDCIANEFENEVFSDLGDMGHGWKV